MQTATRPARISGKALWTGRVLSGLAIVFMLFDSAVKIAKAAPAVQGTVGLGYPASSVQPIGFALLACVVLYIIPRTAAFGAVLLTGYLGGAVASNVRVGSSWATHILFPVYVAVLIWGGLFLRDGRVRALLSREVE